MDGSHRAEMHRCIVELDAEAAWKLWAHIAPAMPQPKTLDDVRKTLHYARTINGRVDFHLRAYSHAWLLDHDLPSGLPDRLKPRAERLYPRIVQSAAYSVNFRSPVLRPLKSLVMKEIDIRINELWADGDKEPGRVSQEIAETKDKAIRKLVGTLPRES